MGEAGEFRLEQPTAGLLYGYQVGRDSPVSVLHLDRS